MNKNVEIRKAQRQDVLMLMDGIILVVGEVERLDVGKIRNKDQFRYIIGFCLT